MATPPEAQGHQVPFLIMIEPPTTHQEEDNQYVVVLNHPHNLVAPL